MEEIKKLNGKLICGFFLAANFNSNLINSNFLNKQFQLWNWPSISIPEMNLGNCD